jgi:D-alanyl-D-alanine carboxypeptidase/D-alanyl-D-alanine-endopeptidase (penicillin-binding protein 4)
LTPLRSASDPAAQAAAVFTDLLRQRGIAVGREAGRGNAPAGAATLTSIQSRPLSDLVGEMLTTSDNNTAELMLKEIGAVAGGAGTRPAGLAVVQATLQKWGVPLTGVRLVDGSGLDRNDRLTCSALLAVLDHTGPSGPVALGLPIAGQTGTLVDVLRGNPAQGRLRAKTGTLTGSRALSGFVDAADGSRRVSFSYVQNSPAADVAALPVFDALGRVLTTYPAAPPEAALGPQPAAPPS